MVCFYIYVTSDQAIMGNQESGQFPSSIRTPACDRRDLGKSKSRRRIDKLLHRHRSTKSRGRSLSPSESRIPLPDTPNVNRLRRCSLSNIDKSDDDPLMNTTQLAAKCRTVDKLDFLTTKSDRSSYSSVISESDNKFEEGYSLSSQSSDYLVSKESSQYLSSTADPYVNENRNDDYRTTIIDKQSPSAANRVNEQMADLKSNDALDQIKQIIDHLSEEQERRNSSQESVMHIERLFHEEDLNDGLFDEVFSPITTKLPPGKEFPTNLSRHKSISDENMEHSCRRISPARYVRKAKRDHFKSLSDLSKRKSTPPNSISSASSLLDATFKHKRRYLSEGDSKNIQTNDVGLDEFDKDGVKLTKEEKWLRSCSLSAEHHISKPYEIPPKLNFTDLEKFEGNLF